MTDDTPTPAALIAIARERIVSLERELINLGARRRSLLMSGAQTEEIAKFDLEHARLKAQVAAEEERIAILNEQIHQQEVQNAIAQKDKQIARLSKKLKQTDELAKELESTIGKAVELFDKLCHERSSLVPMFQAGDHEVVAAINNHQGAVLTPSSISALLSFELYRQCARPTVPGVPKSDEVSFPLKAINPNLGGMPEAIKPFSAAIAQASEYTVSLLRTGRAPAIMTEAQASPDGQPRTAAQMHLNELLAKMAALASDPSREPDYLLILKEVALAQDKVELERKAVSQAVADADTADRPKGSPAEQQLDALRRRSVKMVYAQESNAIEYAKLSAQIAVLTAELKQQGVTV
jgi:hypothetical protein